MASTALFLLAGCTKMLFFYYAYFVKLQSTVKFVSLAANEGATCLVGLGESMTVYVPDEWLKHTT